MAEQKKKIIKKTGTKKPAEKNTANKTESAFSIILYNLQGKNEGTAELPKQLFDVNAKPELISQYVRVYLSNQRQGNASTKTRGEVTGSTRKIYRQKGTGKARHGDIKAPIFVGGGTVGGPKPRDYSLKLNKKQKQAAFFGALTLKRKDNNILGLISLKDMMEPKTKSVMQFIKSMQLNNQSLIFVFPKLENNYFVLAARNIENVTLRDLNTLNTYDVLKADKVIFVEDALTVLSKKYS